MHRSNLSRIAMLLILLGVTAPWGCSAAPKAANFGPAREALERGDSQSALSALESIQRSGTETLQAKDKIWLLLLLADARAQSANHSEPYFGEPADRTKNAADLYTKAIGLYRDTLELLDKLRGEVAGDAAEIEFRANYGISNAYLRLGVLNDDQNGLENARRGLDRLKSQPLAKSDPRFLWSLAWLEHNRAHLRGTTSTTDYLQEEVAAFLKSDGHEQHHGAYRDMLDYVYPYATPHALKRLQAKQRQVAECFMSAIRDYLQANDQPPAEWNAFREKATAYFDSHRKWYREQKRVADLVEGGLKSSALSRDEKRRLQGEFARADNPDFIDDNYKQARKLVEEGLVDDTIQMAKNDIDSKKFSSAEKLLLEAAGMMTFGYLSDKETLNRQINALRRERTQGLAVQEAENKVMQIVAAGGSQADAQAIIDQTRQENSLGSAYLTQLGQIESVVHESYEGLQNLVALDQAVQQSTSLTDDLKAKIMHCFAVVDNDETLRNNPSAKKRKARIAARLTDDPGSLLAALDKLENPTTEDQILKARALAQQGDNAKAAEIFNQYEDVVSSAVYSGTEDKRSTLEVAARCNQDTGNLKQGALFWRMAGEAGSKKASSSEATCLINLHEHESDPAAARSYCDRLMEIDSESRLDARFQSRLRQQISLDYARQSYDSAYRYFERYRELDPSLSGLPDQELDNARRLMAFGAVYLPARNGEEYRYAPQGSSKAGDLVMRFSSDEKHKFTVTESIGNHSEEWTWSIAGKTVFMTNSETKETRVLAIGCADPTQIDKKSSSDEFESQIVGYGKVTESQLQSQHRDCIQVEVRRRAGNWTKTYWLAPGVGIVKLQSPGGTFVLKSRQ